MMFVCSKCGEKSPVWVRYCPVCSAENALRKESLEIGFSKTQESASSELVRLPSGFPHFDRIFHGGFLLTFVYFIHAERGAGKTTFLLQVCAYLVSIGKTVVFFSFDEGIEGTKKKCLEYELTANQPVFIFENSPGVIERTIHEQQPDFVVIDSLQSLEQYDAENTVKILYRLRKEAQKHKFAMVVVGEERKDRKDYLGSASIGHIVDVLMKMKMGLDEEVVISTPDKNRDTDDRTSRCFFRRTPTGLVEIQESETGYLPRHSEKAVVGLAAFIAKDGNDFFVDEITAALDRDKKKASLTIAGISQAKAKSLLAVLSNTSEFIDAGIVLRANRTERLSADAELACMIAALSLLLEKPLPADTAFMGGVDNRGYLLPVYSMEQRVKRAKALGYKRIIGPKANGSQIEVWEEQETLDDVRKALSQ
jgi:DNA repair protein RadA/Sms